MKNNKIIIAVLIIFNVIIYYNGIMNEFVWDDSYVVRDNYYIRDIGNIKDLMMREDAGASVKTGYFRPFVNLTYMLDYQLFKGSAFGYRLTNIAYSIASAIALFFLTLLITDCRRLSLAGALIFSAQAVHVEAVTFIAGRNNVICTFFILLSLYYYVKNAKATKGIYITLSMLFMLLGMLSKEFAFVLPLLFILYDLSFEEGFLPRKHLKKYAAAFSLAALTLAYRALAIPLRGALSLNTSTLYLRVINTFKIFVDYIRFQIVPINLAIYFDYPFEKSILAPPIIFSILLLALITALVIVYRKKERVLFFTFFAYLILLLPVSNIIEIPGTVMADRWLYPASAMFAVFLARLIQIACRKRAALIPVVTIIFVITLSVFTIGRNRVFLNDLTFYFDTVQVFPRSAIARNNLGVELKNRGLDLEAESQYKLAMEYNPDYYLPYNNLGVIYGDRGEYGMALDYFYTSFGLNPKYALSAFNIAAIHDLMGNYDEANRYYIKSINLDPDQFNPYYNLASNYERNQEYEKALDVLSRAAEVPFSDVQHNELIRRIKVLHLIQTGGDLSE